MNVWEYRKREGEERVSSTPIFGGKVTLVLSVAGELWSGQAHATNQGQSFKGQFWFNT